MGVSNTFFRELTELLHKKHMEAQLTVDGHCAVFAGCGCISPALAVRYVGSGSKQGLHPPVTYRSLFKSQVYIMGWGDPGHVTLPVPLFPSVQRTSGC